MKCRAPSVCAISSARAVARSASARSPAIAASVASTVSAAASHAGWLSSVAEPARFLGGGERDVAVGEADGVHRQHRQQPRERTEAPVGPGTLDGRVRERQALLERPADQPGRGQIARRVVDRRGARGGNPEAVDDAGRVAERVGVRVDRDEPGIGGGGRSRPVGGSR